MLLKKLGIAIIALAVTTSMAFAANDHQRRKPRPHGHSGFTQKHRVVPHNRHHNNNRWHGGNRWRHGGNHNNNGNNNINGNNNRWHGGNKNYYNYNYKGGGNGNRYFYNNPYFWGGVAGGLIGGAVINEYYNEPECATVYRQVYDPVYGYVERAVVVCD